MTLPPAADALPDALVTRDQWVCWRTHDRDGTATKVPIVPGTTQFASTTDPDSWRSFQTAREAVTTTSVAGLGFVFTADDPLIGVDLDDCREPETGAATQWADTIIDQLASYTEVSPSGTGYHILVSGTLPDGRNRAGKLELYDRSRFFTVTGDHVSDTPMDVTARSEAIAALHATEVAAAAADTATSPADAEQPAAAASGQSAPAAATIPDDELLDRATSAANGAKFTRLWTGTTSGYESHSEADLALCRLLAFWTGGDAQRVDRLFRRSGLYRDKWDTVHYADGSTYGDKTVARAIARTDDEYTPPEATTPADADGPAIAPATAAEAAPDTATQADASTTDGATPEAASASTAGAQPATASDAPAGHPQRVHARRDRIDELTDRVESLLAENERLRQELAAERERRHALETAREDDSAGWWPFSRG